MLIWVLESIKKHSISSPYWRSGPRRTNRTSAKPGCGSLRVHPTCLLPLPNSMVSHLQGHIFLPTLPLSSAQGPPKGSVSLLLLRTPNHPSGFTLHPQQPSTQTSVTVSQFSSLRIQSPTCFSVWVASTSLRLA